MGTRNLSQPASLWPGALVPGGGEIGARLAFDATYIEDFRQSMLVLGISMSWWNWGSGSLSTNFSASHEESRSGYLCRFSQVYLTYGRAGFLAVHSYARRDSVSLAVQAAIDGYGWDTETEMNASLLQILNQSEIKILVQGGDATDGETHAGRLRDRRDRVLGDPASGTAGMICSSLSMVMAPDGKPSGPRL